MKGWVVVSVPAIVLAAIATLVLALARVERMMDTIPSPPRAPEEVVPAPRAPAPEEVVPAPEPAPTPPAGVLVALDLNR